MSDWDFLWGLKGRELEFAMSHGATYEEWQQIHERELQRAMDDDEEEAIREAMLMKMLHDYEYEYMCMDEDESLEEECIRDEERRITAEKAERRLHRRLQEHRAKKHN